jgi:hypothetical protein
VQITAVLRIHLRFTQAIAHLYGGCRYQRGAVIAQSIQGLGYELYDQAIRVRISTTSVARLFTTTCSAALGAMVPSSGVKRQEHEALTSNYCRALDIAKLQFTRHIHMHSAILN